MPVAAQAVPGKSTWKNGLLLGTIGLLAVTAGVVLPQAWTGNSELVPAPTVAEPAKNAHLSYTPPAWPEAPDPKAMLLRLAWGTALVLALCVATLWMGKRWIRGDPLPSALGAHLQIVETVALGNRCSVYLLKAGKCQVLVGVDGGGMKALVALPEPFEATLTDMQATDAPLAESERETAGQQCFTV